MWEVKRAQFDSDLIDYFLSEGWEPFAVCEHYVYFRKQKVLTN